MAYNLISTFEKVTSAADDNNQQNKQTPSASAQHRMYIFDQTKIKRDELVPALSVLLHYLVIDRVLFIAFDFWNFTCDTNINFNLYAFIATPW